MYSDYEIISILSKEQNMRRAAEKLFLTQPALSLRLQNIEKDWGTQLFIRSQKGLMPTPSGEIVIDFSEEVLLKQEQAREKVQVLSSKVHGTLKIACASIVGQNWLPTVLKKYVSHYPEAKISLHTGWSSEIVRSLVEGEAQIGIVRGQTEWKGKKIHLFKDTLYLVDQEMTTLEDIQKSNKPFIQFKSDSSYYQEIQQWWQKNFSMTPKQQIVVDQIETCKQMALNGLGYAILPSITLSDYDHINKIPLNHEDPAFELTRDTWLIGYDAAFELPQVQSFVKMATTETEQELR
ncbi:LysR family transcriptional regulator [Chryseomicrobium excrementi]|uniref:LysR family transcriptional regulator n=1 Tax=Chryseomicrobium excrementi TaxID=2041346 RepID=A0A2M9F3I2_9BACL|nr:LysR family transcriptional regulator [Chryseomicrobium excrementi]PJK18009.1 LysR family transcriptional regulator [Chryseomicrobium excrementi]